MLLRAKLLAMLLAAPALAVVIGLGSRWAMNDDLRTGVRQAAVQSARGIDEAHLARFSLTDACAEPAFRDSSACATYSRLGWLAAGGACTALLGLGLMAGIAIAGRACQRNRLLLLRVFRPGLRGVFVVLVILILLHAALVVGCLAQFGSLQGSGIRLVVLVIAGAALGAWRMIRAATRAVEPPRLDVFGKALNPELHARLVDAVNETARVVGTDPPRRIVVGLEPNFFVTESDVRGLDADLKGRTLYVSLPLCRILTIAEFQAVIGHELGHFKGLDTQFSQHFYPIHAGAMRSLVALAQSTGGFRSVTILPALYLLAFFLESFSTAEASISREREIAADREAARAAGTGAAAAALVKVHAYAPGWQVVLQGMREALTQRRAFRNVSLVFAELITRAAAPERLRDAAAACVVHPTDSHPPLADRLRALGATIEQVTDAALVVAPEASAATLFDDVERLEEDLSEAQRTALVEIRLPTLEGTASA